MGDGFQKIILPSKKFPMDMARKLFEPCAPYFFKDEPRKFQKEIIGVIRYAIEEDNKKYIFLQLGTGAGKSVIALTIAEYFRRVHNKEYFLLSMDHGLTRQYAREYPFLKEVKGRQNFKCVLPLFSHLTCDKAPCSIKTAKKQYECQSKADCPYFVQRDAAAESFGTLSTPYYIDLAVPNHIFERRFLAIRDEAHKLENFYLGIYEIRLTEYDYKELYHMSTLPSYADPEFWASEIQSMMDRCEELLKSAVLDDTIVKLEKLETKLYQLSLLLSMKNNVVIDVETTRRGKSLILFRPVKSSTYAKNIIDNVAEHTIFMTATILSIKDRCDHLGIPMDEVLYINFKDSFFPDENRHFRFVPCGSMSWKRREKTIPKIIEQSARLIRKHGEQRGIIICASHKIRDTIVKELEKIVKNPNYIITHSGAPGSFNESFERFLDRPSLPYVFVTTRYEGLDFYGKLAEYMIYTNLPYAPPMDKQVAARLKMEQDFYTEENGGSCGFELDVRTGMCERGAWCHDCRRWYDLKVAEAFQQALGRVIRTPEDVGFLYVLDSRFEKFYKQNSDLFLSYIRKTIDNEWRKR